MLRTVRWVSTPSWLLVTIVASLALVACGSGAEAEKAGTGADGANDFAQNRVGDWPAGPVSVQDLIARGETIMIGHVANDGETRYEGAFDSSTGGFAVSTPKTGEPTFGFPHTYYTIEIEEVLLDDGFVRQSTVLRMPGKPATSLQPKSGNKFLFVLARNPGNASYGIRGYWAILDINGSTVEDIAGQSVGYAQTNQTDAFLNQVREAIQNRQS